MDVSVPMEVVKSKIFLIRGQKVFLDSDLAELYGVETRRLNEQVSRNRSRFPDDFMFQLNPQEFAGLISQTAISKPGRGGRANCPMPSPNRGSPCSPVFSTATARCR